MSNKIDINELVQRISSEPSVLFLGQDYLSSYDGRNVFYDAINRSFFKNQLSTTANYTEVWNNINNGDKIADNDISHMYEILMNDIPVQRWLRKILSMRWGMIMTSAIDAVMLHCVGDNFFINPISIEQRRFNRKYIEKNKINLSLLFGSISMEQDFLPRDCSRKTFQERSKKIHDRINWIYNEILPEYGVLVIDGWNPNIDWLDYLLHDAGEMPYESIYLFGANQDLIDNEDVAFLVENNVLIYDERTFAQALLDNGYFDDENDELSAWGNDTGRIITLNLDNETCQLNISNDSIALLDPHINVLYDDLWVRRDSNNVEIGQLYAQFQRQTEPPIWNLYSSKYSFYFRRNYDDLLREYVEKEFHKNPYNRKYIILEGNSNTGKTASLIHLAYTERYSAPVLYICGEPTQINWMEELKDFIKIQFIEKQCAGKWIKSILVIWDGNTDYNAQQRCSKLQNVLRETNAIVVGSAYAKSWDESDKNIYRDLSGNYHIVVKSDLDDTETNEMLTSVSNINPEIAKYLKNSSGKSAHLLETLHKLIKLTYQPEWKAVSEAIQSRFIHEVSVNEEYADSKLSEYMASLADEVEKEIGKYGVASSWQIQLSQISKQLFDSGMALNEEKKDQLNQLCMMEKRIQKLNRILALSGEYSVELPLTLVLRMMSDGYGKIYSDEQKFLLEIIGSDSLLRANRNEDGLVLVCFRNPSEAEIYVKKNFGDDDLQIKQNEVDLLKEIICACRWGDDFEQIPVLQLVRSFGPNSWGTPSRPRIARHYIEYCEWWEDIASTLKEEAADQEEASLVYALLIRSSCRENVENKQDTTDIYDKMNSAKEVLREAIENHNQINVYQYCRLLGEMCANLVFSMKNKQIDRFSIFQQLKIYFARAVDNWSDNHSQNQFTKNDLLDIWLNGVSNYLEGYTQDACLMEDAKIAEIIALSIQYISLLFDVSEEGFENEKLLEKVNRMYSYVDIDKTDSFEKSFEEHNNDTALFLKAWKAWNAEEIDETFLLESDAVIRNFAKNMYLIPDDYDKNDGYGTELNRLVMYAKSASVQVISILENNMMLIKKSSSTRCLQMLIRAKWLSYTGQFPMTSKQKPKLSIEQWREIGDLCDLYIQYSMKNNEQMDMAIVMLRMIYVWCFTNNKEEFEQLKERQHLLRGNDWYYERICLCNPINGEPKKYYVNLIKNRNSLKNEYVATIAESLDGKEKGSLDEIDKNIVGVGARKIIHVPARIREILLNGKTNQDAYRIDKAVTIWFNAKGPQLGMAEGKEGKNR